MMRYLIALIAGGFFGAGLYVSGMTDTQKVRGFLDITGAWDPTLMFVMGGALLPMAIAWRMTKSRQPVAGGSFSGAPSTRISPELIGGAVLFGMGWGLVGLCPGPAIGSISYGGTGGLIFLVAMIAGMIGSGPVRHHLDRRQSVT